MNNFVNRFFMWCFMLLTGIYKRFGADIDQLKVILITKLTIDDRTATGLYAVHKRNKEGDSNLATVVTMVIALIIGILFALVFMIDDDLNRLTIYFTLFGFMLAMFLITDFSHILVDVKDNFIILPKPVSSQTFLLARLIHIIIHVSKILLPMALPAWIAMWISRGVWGAVVFIPAMLLFALLTFTLVNAVYLLIMRIFSPARINSIITTLQIVFTIILYGGIQGMSHMIGETFLEINITDFAWIWIFPSFWIAAGWTCIYSFNTGSVYLIGTILSIVVPIVGLWVMIRFLAPAFFRKLSMISAGTETKIENESKAMHVEGGVISAWPAKIFTKQGIEREAYLFVWRMTGRNRDFKLKIYPQIGYMLILAVVFIVGGNNNIMDVPLDLTSTRIKSKVLLYVYFSCILYTSALFQLPYYALPKAAWIYFCAPLARPGLIIRGAVKACLAKFFLPIVIIMTLAGLVIFGPVILPHLLFGFGNVFLACSIVAWFAIDKLPFSVALEMASEGQGSMRNFLMLIFLPLFGFPHYFLFDFPLVVTSLSVLTITAGYLLLRYMQNISWRHVSA